MSYIQEIVFVVILLALLACIPYGFYILRLLIKQSFKKALTHIVYASAVVFSLFFLHTASGVVDDSRVFGYFAYLGEPLFEYNSSRSFNGDGYSFYVYDAPEHLIEKLKNPPTSFFNDFPKKPNIRKKWKVQRWQITPTNKNDITALRFVFVGADPQTEDTSSMLNNFTKDLDLLLSNTGNLYSFFYTRSIDRPGDIDFFAVDKIKKRIYVINHNT